MLWATVQEAGGRMLLSEDFQDGRTLGQVSFIDPFDDKNAAVLDHAFGQAVVSTSVVQLLKHGAPPVPG
jgi:hypothetical protein